LTPIEAFQQQQVEKLVLCFIWCFGYSLLIDLQTFCLATYVLEGFTRQQQHLAASSAAWTADHVRAWGAAPGQSLEAQEVI
jgi:hypothetical protein